MTTKKEINWKSVFSPKTLIYSILGSFIAVVALRGFMIPNHFLDGGVTGVSILINEIFHIEISILLIVFNLPFVIIGYKKIGKTFAAKTLLAILFLTIFMHTLSIPVVTEDSVLIAVFGGILIGLGIGLVIRGGGVIDGLEVIADYTNQESNFTTSEVILLVNSLLMFGVAFEFGIETAMYSILTYYTAMKVSNFVVDGFEEFTALTVVSGEHDKIKSLISNDFNKAFTVYKGERGYLPGKFEVQEDCDFIMIVVTRLEVHQLKKAIEQIDLNAFIYVQRIKEVRGGLIKQNKSHG